MIVTLPVRHAIANAAARLAAVGIERPVAEARLLLSHATGLAAAVLVGDPDRQVALTAFDEAVDRRERREPLAYITGRAAFWTLDLAVSPATLIPRADTETLIEAALAVRPDRRSVRTVLDLGTGTGNLLLAALAEYPAAWGVGVDSAAAACRLARGNAARNGLGPRAVFLCGSWADALAGRFDLVLSNPPYVRAAAIAGLMPEVAGNEPVSALDGGPDGLDAYRALLGALPALLAPAGLAVLELGAGQAGTVAALAAPGGWTVATRPDLAGHPRALTLQHSQDGSAIRHHDSMLPMGGRAGVRAGAGLPFSN